MKTYADLFRQIFKRDPVADELAIFEAGYSAGYAKAIDFVSGCDDEISEEEIVEVLQYSCK